MNRDIRINCDFFDNPKAVRLQSKLGPAGVVALVRLWIFAGKYRCNGVFTGMTKADLLTAAGWKKRHDDLIDTLVEVGLIDDLGENYAVHDWHDHNGYAAHALDRSKQSRAAAEKRWNAERNADSNADANAGGNRPIPIPIPIPNPNPSPTPKKKPSCQKQVSDDDLAIAKQIFGMIRTLNPTHKEPNFNAWANDVRLMVERDKRTHAEIIDLFTWANGDAFWKTNILSPAKLRTQWDALVVKRGTTKAAEPYWAGTI